MDFWERVDELLDEKYINKKTLAYEAGFDASNITKGIKNHNSPSAVTAVKIARVLGVTVEYLVTGSDSAAGNSGRTHAESALFKKYRNTLEKLDALPDCVRRPILEMIEKINAGQRFGFPSE